VLSAAAAPLTTTAVGDSPPAENPVQAAKTLSATEAVSGKLTAVITGTGAVPGATVTVATTPETTPAVALQLVLPTPTPTVEPTPTPTPAPQVYQLRPGDTLFELAMRYDVALEDLLTVNGLTEDDVYTIQPGQEIIIPTGEVLPPATATLETPTETDEAAAPVSVEKYIVSAGDTMITIALRNRVTMEELLTANGMTIADARLLRPGQEILIPVPGGSLPEPTPTATPAATATPVATSTPATAATSAPATVRVDAPQLRSPENATSVSCSAPDALVWEPVSALRATDLYLLHLGYVKGKTTAGGEEIVWVLEQQRPANVTSWGMDTGLCGLAPLDQGRQWRWYVEVAEKGADGTLAPVSPPSQMWGFTWQ
jgi:LysM repeat protein